MKKEKAVAPGASLLNRIKILAVQAMFSDDDLLEKLVLKGGNAMVLIHRVSARTSVDLDFSLEQDFGDDIAGVRVRIEKLLTEAFATDGLYLFDFEMLEKPKAISEDMKHFWGGYEVVFKLATAAVYAEHGKDTNELRRRALRAANKTMSSQSRGAAFDDAWQEKEKSVRRYGNSSSRYCQRRSRRTKVEGRGCPMNSHSTASCSCFARASRGKTCRRRWALVAA